jgi:acetyl/propionyl-CoA carboxylase alpha subunit
MLGKVIAWGTDREAARLRLVEGLERVAVLGLTTNTGFLAALAGSNEFRDATIDTAWLDHHDVPPPGDEVARLLGAHALAPRQTGSADPWRHDGWRSAADPAPVVVELGGPVTVTEKARVSVVHAVVGPLAWVNADIDGQAQSATVRDTSASVEVVHRGQRYVFDRHDPFADHGPAAGDGTLTAPMPGTVLAVNVAEGQAVAEGETLGVMEAMKMELALKAPFAGTVTSVGAAAGDLVKLGATLFVVEADA